MPRRPGALGAGRRPARAFPSHQRPLMRARGLPILVALLLFALDAAKAAPDGGAAPREPGGRPLGIGEPREPEPFTPELRLLDAARRGDRRTVELMLERGVSVETRDDLGRTPLLLAARDAGSLELVRFLRAKGAAADVADLGGQTPLSWAAAAGRLDLVRELAGWGAAVDSLDEDFRTPLFHAVLGGHREVVAFLLERGADPNSADRFGDTPLMMACAKAHGELAADLLEHGADPARRNQEGRTARDRAASVGAEPCLKLPK